MTLSTSIISSYNFLYFEQTYCRHKDHNDVFECLKNSMNSDGFDAKCRGVVLRRAMQQTKGTFWEG